MRVYAMTKASFSLRKSNKIPKILINIGLYSKVDQVSFKIHKIRFIASSPWRFKHGKAMSSSKSLVAKVGTFLKLVGTVPLKTAFLVELYVNSKFVSVLSKIFKITRLISLSGVPFLILVFNSLARTSPLCLVLWICSISGLECQCSARFSQKCDLVYQYLYHFIVRVRSQKTCCINELLRII